MSKFKYSIKWQEVVEQDPASVPEDVQTEQDLVKFITNEHDLINVQEEDEGEYSFIINEGQGEDEGFGRFSIYEEQAEDDLGDPSDWCWTDAEGNRCD